jgi:hypothetical protein
MSIESKLVGELGANSAQFSFVDEEEFDSKPIVSTEVGGDFDEEEEDVEEIIEEEIIEDDEPIETGADPYDDDDLSEGAILASIWQREGVLDTDIEIPKDISIKDLKDKVQEAWMKENRDKFEEEIEKLGFTPEMKRYVEDIMSGVDPDTISVSSQYEQIASLPIKGDDEVAAKNREFVILERYKAQGLTAAKAKRLYESAVDNGDEDEEAEEAQAFFAKEGKEIKQREAAEKAAEDQRQEREKEEKVNKVKEVIGSGNISGIKLNKIEAENLKKALFDQTETVQLENGKKIKVTKFSKQMQDYNNNVEHQVLFAYLVTNNFDISSLKKAAKIEASDDLFNFLGGKVTKRKRAHEGFSSEYKGEI